VSGMEASEFAADTTHAPQPPRAPLETQLSLLRRLVRQRGRTTYRRCRTIVRAQKLQHKTTVSPHEACLRDGPTESAEADGTEWQPRQNKLI
jgi:hypothetical protein